MGIDRIRNTVRQMTFNFNGFVVIVESVMKTNRKWAGYISRTKGDRYTKQEDRKYETGKGRPKLGVDQEVRLVGRGITWRKVAGVGRFSVQGDMV